MEVGEQQIDGLEVEPGIDEQLCVPGAGLKPPAAFPDGVLERSDACRSDGDDPLGGVEFAGRLF